MHNKSIYQIFVLLLIGLSITAQNGVCADFMRGADISIQTRQEADGVVYNEYGYPNDAVIILKNHDFNWIRIRLFHTPNPSDYGASMDLAYVTDLAARVKTDGFKFLLNFHYSDTWADPSHQTIPDAWEGMSHSELVTAVHDYTEDVIEQLRLNNAMPDMVQIGNEIRCGMLWPDGNPCSGGGGSWSNLAELINAGIAGVDAGRGTEPMPEIMIHIDRGGNQSSTEWFFNNLLAQGVQFDVIGQSFYPEWHGTLDDLTTNLNFMAANYSQDIIVAETGEYYTSGGATPESQKAFLEELIERVQDTPDGKGRGVCYWEPTWVWGSPVGWKALFEPISGNWRNVDMLMGMEAFDKIYGDMTGNGIVNFEDLPGFLEFWLEDNAELDLDGNSVINFHEFSVLAQNWR